MFQRCTNENEVNKLFKRLALRLHPDCGGEDDLMALLIEYKDQAIIIFREVAKNSSSKQERTSTYEKAYEDIHCSDSERLKIIEDIKEYAKTHPKFSMAFTESVEDFLIEEGYITSSQYNALVKIYHSFRMYEKGKNGSD